MRRYGRRQNKYGAVKTFVHGRMFDSKAEARRFQELLLLGRAGVIENLELQPAFPLHAVNLRTGEIVRVGNFRADFRYQCCDTGEWVVEDVKGMKILPLARWKQKHCLGEYGVSVREVR